MLCKIAHTFYCSFCAGNFGHTTGNCPHDRPLPPVPHTLSPPVAYPPTLDVIDLPENVRAFLLTAAIPLSGKPKENRRRLAEYATQNKLRLVWHDTEGRIKK